VFAPPSRLPFLIAVALVAAALGDAVVETVANSGLVGRGYADDNHLSVVPTLVAGGLLALDVARRRCLELLRRGKAERPDWLIAFARQSGAASPWRDAALVFTLQLAALFAMESAEQLAVGGKLLGGNAWLGGPILFALLAHALIAIGCTFALAFFGRALLGTIATLVRDVLESILLVLARGADSGVAAGRRRRAPLRRAFAAHARQFGDRAPPHRSFVPA